jgi:hypothetical protein
VNDLEGQLAELLKAGVADPPVPVTVEAVRQQKIRRLAAAAAGVTTVIAVVVVVAVAAVTGVFTASSPSVGGPVRPAAGPSAGQLAHDSWVTMPAAPFRLCDPVSVWDGQELLVVEPGVRVNGWCPARAAAYDPRSNSWRPFGDPPGTIGSQVGAWGGGRLVLVTTRNGKTIALNPASSRWQRLPPVPAGGIPSITWTGRSFLVIMARGRHARAFTLTGTRWQRLPDLPEPATGSIVGTAAAAWRGAVYVLADVAHIAPPSGSVELFRLTASGWTSVPVSAGLPASHFTLTAITGGIVATGSACPGKGGCTMDINALAILRPGARQDVTTLNPRPGVPAVGAITAGGNVVVVTNPVVSGFTAKPPTRKCLIYDISMRTWLRGRDTPTSQGGIGTYWTRYGVVVLTAPASAGQSSRPAGWLLGPPHIPHLRRPA